MATTITRESSGVITLVQGDSTLYITNPENVTIKEAYGTTIVIDFLGVQQYYIVYSELTAINGGAVPGTIAAATLSIAENVFNPS